MDTIPLPNEPNPNWPSVEPEPRTYSNRALPVSITVGVLVGLIVAVGLYFVGESNRDSVALMLGMGSEEAHVLYEQPFVVRYWWATGITVGLLAFGLTWIGLTLRQVRAMVMDLLVED